MLSAIIILRRDAGCYYAECRYAECRDAIVKVRHPSCAFEVG